MRHVFLLALFALPGCLPMARHMYVEGAELRSATSGTKNRPPMERLEAHDDDGRRTCVRVTDIQTVAGKPVAKGELEALPDGPVEVVWWTYASPSASPPTAATCRER